MINLQYKYRKAIRFNVLIGVEPIVYLSTCANGMCVSLSQFYDMQNNMQCMKNLRMLYNWFLIWYTGLGLHVCTAQIPGLRQYCDGIVVKRFHLKRKGTPIPFLILKLIEEARYMQFRVIASCERTENNNAEKLEKQETHHGIVLKLNLKNGCNIWIKA